MKDQNHIIELRSENIKRIRAVAISPKSPLVVIGGRNAQGKTSVLDSICMALGGASVAPEIPVRKGQDSGQIVLKLDNGITITRTFTAEGKTTLKVITADGAKYTSPQSILDQLTGKLTFDPMEFLRLKPEQQADTLRRLVNLDLSKFDADRAKAYAERTELNRKAEDKAAQLRSMPTHEVPEQPVSVAELSARLQAAHAENDAKRSAVTQHNLAVETARAQADAAAKRVTEKEAAIADLKKRLNTAEVELGIAKTTQSQAKAKYDGLAAKSITPELTPTDPIAKQICEAEEVNRKIAQNATRKAIQQEAATIREAAGALTAKIEAIDAEKANALASVKFPVPGLSFSGDSVTFNGIPIKQCSAAEQQRVSVAIGAALNPRLRVMLVRDASLLDDESLASLAKLAESFNLQIWAERVGKGAECSVVIEDGQIEQAIEQPPVVVVPECNY